MDGWQREGTMNNAMETKRPIAQPAPWRMHEFFAGSGLVSYGLQGMFDSVWANDISEQKAAVYEARQRIAKRSHVVG